MCIFLMIPCLYNSLSASPAHFHTQPPGNPKSFSLAVKSWATFALLDLFFWDFRFFNTLYSSFFSLLLWLLCSLALWINCRHLHSPQISDGEFLSSPSSFSKILQTLLVFSPERLSNSNCCVGDVTQDAPWVIRRVSLIKKNPVFSFIVLKS